MNLLFNIPADVTDEEKRIFKKASLENVEFQSALMDLKRTITCPICRGTLDEPKRLICNHAFCYTCYDDLVEHNDANNILTCPLCHAESNIKKDVWPDAELGEIVSNMMTIVHEWAPDVATPPLTQQIHDFHENRLGRSFSSKALQDALNDEIIGDQIEKDDDDNVDVNDNGSTKVKEGRKERKESPVDENYESINISDNREKEIDENGSSTSTSTSTSTTTTSTTVCVSKEQQVEQQVEQHEETILKLDDSDKMPSVIQAAGT